MTQLRLDKVQMCSQLDTYINYKTSTSNIVVPAITMANNQDIIYSTTIPYTRAKTRADVYLRNTTTGIKRPAWGGTVNPPYSPVSTEGSLQYVTYGNDYILVELEIFNGTGGSITLTAQTLEVTAVFYEVPFSG